MIFSMGEGWASGVRDPYNSAQVPSATVTELREFRGSERRPT